ncbi:MAG: carboxylating nicotinate-nucleotide diphosphorylase [Eubacteriales bacterium]|nr:carboxylating nicotinate-nucleotide diphosphorylase [Eubacteriales bacterium]
MIPDNLYLDSLIENALREDMPFGDITTDNLIPAEAIARARIVAKESGVIAGMEIARRVFQRLDREVEFSALVDDGQEVEEGVVVAEITGSTRALLKGERTALNFLAHLSGIATAANRYAKVLEQMNAPQQANAPQQMNAPEQANAPEHTNAHITDTRKTIPGLRRLEKYAVKVGGGKNHRFSLSDGVLIKDNHIDASGSITEAVRKVREAIPHTAKIEVEVQDLDQVSEAVEVGVDIIMLDNMDIETMREAVKIINKRAVVEASGNVTIERLPEIAATGVDIISSGALTHSAKALDLSLKFK